MRLFEDKLRNTIEHKTSSKAMFTYLDESSHSKAEYLRKLLNRFFETFNLNSTPEETKEIYQRIKSNNDEFHSAFFELMIHFILINQGYELEIHPTLDNCSKKPDFLVKHKNGENFYLELVTVQDVSGCKHIEQVNDVFFQNQHDNFCVITEHNNGQMNSSPKVKDLRNKIFTWLDNLDPDTELLRDKNHLSSMKWEHDDFSINIKAFPLSKDQRAKGLCLFNGSISPERIITTEQNLIKSLKKKATKYGSINIPFIIAVALSPREYSFPLTKNIQLQTLFGKQSIYYNKNSDSKLKYSGNSLWLHNNKPQNTKNSGIWFFDFPSIFSLPELRTNLYLNPWATHQLKSSLYEFPHTTLDSSAFPKLKIIQQNGNINPLDILQI